MVLYALIIVITNVGLKYYFKDMFLKKRLFTNLRVAMNFNEYKSYEDFCEKTGLHGRAAIEILLFKLKGLQKN